MIGEQSWIIIISIHCDFGKVFILLMPKLSILIIVRDKKGWKGVERKVNTELKVMDRSSESSGLSFAFHEFEDVSNSDGSLDISDKVTFVCLFSGDKDDFDLGDTSSGSGPAQKLSDSCLYGFDFHVVIIIFN